MDEELEKEKEKYKNLGRCARRKKERELQRKYKKKDIRIKSGKRFKKNAGLNREQRRTMMHDKDFLREIRKNRTN